MFDVRTIKGIYICQDDDDARTIHFNNNYQGSQNYSTTVCIYGWFSSGKSLTSVIESLCIMCVTFA